MMTKLGWDGGGGHKITGLPEEIIDSAKITTGCALPPAFAATFQQIRRISSIYLAPGIMKYFLHVCYQASVRNHVFK